MISAFVWLDYSERERRKMLDVVDLFREHDSRDELGVGSVRDAFADMLFPNKRSAGRIKRTRTRSISYKERSKQQVERDENEPTAAERDRGLDGVEVGPAGLGVGFQ